VEQAVVAFEHGARADEAALCEAHGAVARLGGPAGVHAFGPGAVGQVFDQAAGHAAGDAEGVDEFFFRQAQRGAYAGDGAHHAEDGRGVKAGLVHAHGRDLAEAAHDFQSDCDAAQQVGARELVALGRGQQRRDDDHAGMHGPAFVGVVEVLAVAGNAVDEGRAFGRELARAPMTVQLPSPSSEASAAFT
jgi:hypothetical protein